MSGACARHAAIRCGPRRGETHSPSLLAHPKYSHYYSRVATTSGTHVVLGE